VRNCCDALLRIHHQARQSRDRLVHSLQPFFGSRYALLALAHLHINHSGGITLHFAHGAADLARQRFQLRCESRTMGGQLLKLACVMPLRFTRSLLKVVMQRL